MRNVINEAFLEQIELFTLSVKDNVAGLFGGNHKSKKYGSSCEFADYRDYVEGDDITKIDRKLYGKFDKMYLKLFLDERQMQTRIYIDASKSMSYFDKGAKALELAATLAYMSINEMDKVSIYVIKDKICDPIIENIIGKDSFMLNIGKLNDIKFEGESYIREAIVSSTVGYGNGRSIIISDFLTDNNYNDAIDYLRDKKRDVLCLQILGEEELNPKFSGKNIIYDSEKETDFYKENITKNVIDAYYKALDYVENHLSSFCQSREADYLMISTKDTLKEIFLDKMVQRGIIK